MTAPSGSIPHDAGFQPYFEKNGVTVEIFRSRQQEPWIRGSFTVPASAESVFRLLSDFSRYSEIFSHEVASATVVASTDRFSVLHLVWDMPFPISNRDALVRYQADRCPDGGYRIYWLQEPTDANIPVNGIRIREVEGETVIRADGAARCAVTYTYYGELGGRLPGWMKEHAWRKEPVQYSRAVIGAVSK